MSSSDQPTNDQPINDTVLVMQQVQSAPDQSDQMSGLTLGAIQLPKLLTDTEIEVEHENVQKTVRSMAEYCKEFKKRNERAVALAWNDITVTTADGSKTLLTGASGMVQSRFLAIMGPSGSGKTTLMNVLARRMAGAKMDGLAKINGSAYSNSELKAVSGYVMQVGPSLIHLLGRLAQWQPHGPRNLGLHGRPSSSFLHDQGGKEATCG